jgi:hypothetical protein
LLQLFESLATLDPENEQTAAVVLLQEPVSEEVAMRRKEMEQQSHQCWRKQEQEVLEEVMLVAEQPARESDARDPSYTVYLMKTNVEVGY